MPTIGLFSIPIGGGTAVTLTGPLGPSQVVRFDIVISSDSSTVVYAAEQDTDLVFELYAVPIAGGTVTKLNDPLTSGGNVINFALSADGATTVYLADQDVDQRQELYSVPTSGGVVVRLNATLVAGGDVLEYGISRPSWDRTWSMTRRGTR